MTALQFSRIDGEITCGKDYMHALKFMHDDLPCMLQTVDCTQLQRLIGAHEIHSSIVVLCVPNSTTLTGSMVYRIRLSVHLFTLLLLSVHFWFGLVCCVAVAKIWNALPDSVAYAWPQLVKLRGGVRAPSNMGYGQACGNHF